MARDQDLIERLRTAVQSSVSTRMEALTKPAPEPDQIDSPSEIRPRELQVA